MEDILVKVFLVSMGVMGFSGLLVLFGTFSK